MNENKGFALVDVIAGMLILSIGISCLANLSLNTRYYIAFSQWKSKAANAAQSQLEEVRTIDWEEIRNRFPFDETVETATPEGIRLCTVVHEYNLNLAEIEVTASWEFQDKPGSVTFSNLLSRR